MDEKRRKYKVVQVDRISLTGEIKYGLTLLLLDSKGE